MSVLLIGGAIVFLLLAVAFGVNGVRLLRQASRETVVEHALPGTYDVVMDAWRQSVVISTERYTSIVPFNQFCRYCGERIVASGGVLRSNRFDSHSGGRVYRVLVQCPRSGSGGTHTHDWWDMLKQERVIEGVTK